eukprot:Nk52_evm29s2039 gene=Nk52_evmTU29s2039
MRRRGGEGNTSVVSFTDLKAAMGDSRWAFLLILVLCFSGSLQESSFKDYCLKDMRQDGTWNIYACVDLPQNLSSFVIEDSVYSLSLEFEGRMTTPISISAWPRVFTDSSEQKVTLRELNLGGVNLATTLPNVLFENSTTPMLEKIELHGMNIDSIPSNFFGQLSNIKEINLSDNSISMIPLSLFSNNPLLERLYLDNNPFNALPNAIFAEHCSLLNLTITHSDIVNLPSSIFQHCHNLSSLTLSYSNIMSLPSDLFANSPRLTQFIASSTKLGELPMGLFASSKKLKYIDISNNKRLAKLPSDLLSGQADLSFFQMSSSSVTGFEDGFFKDAVDLIYIEINNNPIEEMPCSIFAGNGGGHTVMNRAFKLGWQRLNVSTLPNCLWSVFPQLSVALFSYNSNLQYFDVASLASLKHLTILEMKGLTNPSFELKDTSMTSVFPPLTSLQTLSLGGGAFSDLLGNSPEALSYLSALQLFELQDTNIDRLPEGMFSNNRNISHIFITGNRKLKRIPSNFLVSQHSDSILGNLAVLDLSGNALCSLPDNLLNRVTSTSAVDRESLGTLKIGNNDFTNLDFLLRGGFRNCSIGVVNAENLLQLRYFEDGFFQRIYSDRTIRKLSVVNKDMSCGVFGRDNVKYLSNNYLNLQSNFLQTLPCTIFKDNGDVAVNLGNFDTVLNEMNQENVFYCKHCSRNATCHYDFDSSTLSYMKKQELWVGNEIEQITPQNRLYCGCRDNFVGNGYTCKQKGVNPHPEPVLETSTVNWWQSTVFYVIIVVLFVVLVTGYILILCWRRNQKKTNSIESGMEERVSSNANNDNVASSADNSYQLPPDFVEESDYEDLDEFTCAARNTAVISREISTTGSFFDQQEYTYSVDDTDSNVAVAVVEDGRLVVRGLPAENPELPPK